MGFVPPPRALTKEEFAKAGFRDIEFEKWVRYSMPWGFIVWLWDWSRGKLINEKNKGIDTSKFYGKDCGEIRSKGEEQQSDLPNSEGGDVITNKSAPSPSSHDGYLGSPAMKDFDYLLNAEKDAEIDKAFFLIHDLTTRIEKLEEPKPRPKLPLKDFKSNCETERAKE